MSEDAYEDIVQPEEGSEIELEEGSEIEPEEGSEIEPEEGSEIEPEEGSDSITPNKEDIAKGNQKVSDYESQNSIDKAKSDTHKLFTDVLDSYEMSDIEKAGIAAKIENGELDLDAIVKLVTGNIKSKIPTKEAQKTSEGNAEDNETQNRLDAYDKGVSGDFVKRIEMLKGVLTVTQFSKVQDKFTRDGDIEALHTYAIKMTTKAKKNVNIARKGTGNTRRGAKKILGESEEFSEFGI